MTLYRSANLSVTDRAVLALRALDSQPGLGRSASEVAAEAGLRTEQVHDALRRAEKRGLAHRCGGHIVVGRSRSVCWHAFRRREREG